MKKIILAIISIVLIVTIGILCFFFRRNKSNSNDSQQDGTTNVEEYKSSALNISNIDEFEEFAKKNKYEYGLGSDKSGGSLFDVPFMDKKTTITYYFDAEGNTIDLSTFYYLNAETEANEGLIVSSTTPDQTAEFVYESIEAFCMMFGCDFVPDYYLACNDGTFNKVEDYTDFQAVIDGSAYIDFSIRDNEGYYWNLNISSEAGVIVATINKYFNIDEFYDYVANISLYEEKE